MMRICYKLTDPDGYTRRGQPGETRWLPAAGQTVAPAGVGRDPGGPGVIHAYASPEEAALYDPVHARYGPGARAIRVEVAEADLGDNGLQLWTPHPVVVPAQDSGALPDIPGQERVAWALCFAPHPATRSWAVRWLSGDPQAHTLAGVAAAIAVVPVTELSRASVRAAVVLAAGDAQAAPELAAFSVAMAVMSAWVLGGAPASNLQDAIRSRSLAALARGRAILRGERPAEEYDADR